MVRSDRERASPSQNGRGRRAEQSFPPTLLRGCNSNTTSAGTVLVEGITGNTRAREVVQVVLQAKKLELGRGTWQDLGKEAIESNPHDPRVGGDDAFARVQKQSKDIVEERGRSEGIAELRGQVQRGLAGHPHGPIIHVHCFVLQRPLDFVAPNSHQGSHAKHTQGASLQKTVAGREPVTRNVPAK